MLTQVSICLTNPFTKLNIAFTLYKILHHIKILNRKFYKNNFKLNSSSTFCHKKVKALK